MSIAQKRVMVAMSGGVDSSVAAFLLKKQGYDVTGVFMKCYNLDGCAVADAEDARRVASHLNIPFYVFDFEEEYKKRVVEYMIDGYKKGITPNPDVMCNKTIKFDLFLKESLKMGTDYIATGHYVKIQKSKIKSQNDNSKFKTIYRLFQAKDKNKDQSYFLWTLAKEQLKCCLFPIGDYLKSEVREIARCAGLPTAEKKDSQGICFLGKISLAVFLKKHIPSKRGDVFDTENRKIGEHDGAWFYTIGQRHGLNLGIKNKKLRIRGRQKTKPHYVVSKDIKTNTLIVAEGENHPALYKKEIELSDVNFINPKSAILQSCLPRREAKLLLRGNLAINVRIRYRQPLAKARLCKIQNTRYKILFDVGQKFIAPGQSAVFYRARRPVRQSLGAGGSFSEGGFKKDELLGGGVIA